MAQANVYPGPEGGRGPDRAANLVDLDRTMLRLRRLMTRMPTTSIPIGGLNRSVDLAKVVACEAVGELGNDGSDVTVKDVANALGLEQSTLSRLLGDAEAEGLVRRSPHPEDRRRVLVSLTSVGEQVVTGAAQARTCLLGYLTDSFSDTEIATLAELMERLAVSVAERMPSWPGPGGGTAAPSAGSDPSAPANPAPAT